VHQLDCVSIIGSRVAKCRGRLPLVKSSFLQPGCISWIVDRVLLRGISSYSSGAIEGVHV
jgi:hypothetical protein